MDSYTKLSDLLLHIGVETLIQMAIRQPHHPADLPHELFSLVLTDGDRSAYNESDIAIAEEAKDFLHKKLEDAHKTINSYLAQKYALPLDEETISQNPLQHHCLNIVRYYLVYDESDDVEAKNRFGQAIQWLRDIATGRAILITPSTTNPVSKNGFYVAPPKTEIDWKTYG